MKKLFDTEVSTIGEELLDNILQTYCSSITHRAVSDLSSTMSFSKER